MLKDFSDASVLGSGEIRRDFLGTFSVISAMVDPRMGYREMK